MSTPAASSSAPAPADARKFSLNLSGLQQEMTPGDHVPGSARKPGSEDFLTTARAHNDEAITVRGAAKVRTVRLAEYGPKRLGASRVKAAWQPGGALLCIASEKDGALLLQTFSRSGSTQHSHNLGPGRPTYCDFDHSGATVAVMQEGMGIYLWDQPYRGPDAPPDEGPPPAPLRLCPSITEATSFCAWSKSHQQLAIGTTTGKVIIFNKAEGVMQLHDKKGKHGAAVTCGDWLSDNRLGLASGNRVKVSQPLPEKGAQWESYSKFKLSGMLSRVPRKFKTAGAPKLLSFSLSYPPFVALCIGDNYMLVFGTSSAKADEDVGLTFPEDYGPISGFQWLEDNMMLVALANGYVTTVDFGAMVRMRQTQGLPECVKATGTTKVFNEYLACLSYTPATQRIGVVGDRGFKILARKGHELEVLADVTLEYTLSVGNHIDSLRWDREGKGVVITATDGWAWAFEIN